MADLPVLAVASEIYPLVKTGGLADVVGGLPAALAEVGVACRTLVPGYPAVMRAIGLADIMHGFDMLFGGPARLLSGRAAGLDLFVIDAPHLYAREGNPYQSPQGTDWPDNAIRFAALARVAASLGQGLVPAYRPAVIHCHDWQAGLTPAYLTYDDMPGPPSVITVHNLAFQGQFAASLLPQLGLPATSFTIDGIEYYSSIGYLKAGLRFADRITTVSPTYAEEIRTPAGGMGLDGLLRGRGDAVTGIANGIDIEVWNPETDPALPARYGPDRLAARATNKLALQTRLGLAPHADAPLFGVVSRLSWQKGLDLLLEALPHLVDAGAQVAVVGTGDPDLQTGFRAAADALAGSVGAVIGYDESLAHVMQGGCDAIVVPSRFEPCGLTQLCAQRYGAVPVVSRVGGLNDTVRDATAETLADGTANGVQFAPVTAAAFADAAARTISLYRDAETWQSLQRAGMATDVSWRGPARRYAALFDDLAGR